MLKQLIQQLMQQQCLSQQQCEQAVAEILSGANECQIAAFLVLLAVKPETPEEVLGFVQTMQTRMVQLPSEDAVIDIVGTGGDGAHTVNFSTAASIVVASCGVKVIKHGNRSVSSQCGSADVLEALGIQIALSPQDVLHCLQQLNIGFCYAPLFHPAMKQLKKIRNALGVRTTFNLLGPLLNPAKACYYVIGVFSKKYLSLMADTVQLLGAKRALVVHGQGLDELSCLGPCDLIEVTQQSKQSFVLDPKDCGLSYCQLADLQGGNAQLNSQLISDALNGVQGPISDTISLNAGAALYVAGHVQSIQTGVVQAQAQLRNGSASRLLAEWQKVSLALQH